MDANGDLDHTKHTAEIRQHPGAAVLDARGGHELASSSVLTADDEKLVWPEETVDDENFALDEDDAESVGSNAKIGGRRRSRRRRRRRKEEKKEETSCD